MQEASILLRDDGDVAIVTLNRPARMNSFTQAMHDELRQALSRVRGNRAVRAMILTGNGRGFCAGQDLGERDTSPGAPPSDLAQTLERNYNPLVLALRGFPVPVVCAVNGVAAGAGANLALAGDVVIAARSASFIQAFSKIGLVPDCGGSWFLPRRVGEARALGLAMLGERLTAEDAERWGLIWRCVDDADLPAESLRTARMLAAGPTHALTETRRVLRAAWDNDLATQLDLERDAQGALGRSADYREGVAAFKEKRDPRFAPR